MIDLVLEYPAQHGSTRKFWLRKGETIQVGRTFQADYTVEQDDQLAPVHFQIQHLGECALVSDLGSTTGTFCNGKKLDRFHLHNGDVIQAGGTRFSAVLNNRNSHDDATSSSEPSSSAAAATSVPECNIPDYDIVDQDNGVSRIDTPAGVELLKKLASKFRLTALVNTETCDCTNSDRWRHRVVDAGCGMAILNLSEADLGAFADDFGGQDGYTIFASSLDITQRLKSISTVFFRSSNIRGQLLDSPAEYTNLLLHNVNAMIVESETPDDWHAFTNTALDAELRDLLGLSSPTSHAPSQTLEVTTLQPSL